jgi:hypothetical protein
MNEVRTYTYRDGDVDDRPRETKVLVIVDPEGSG